MDQGPSRSVARHPALVLPRVVRHLRRSRERPRGLACVHASPTSNTAASRSSRWRTSPCVADLVVDMTSFFERFPSPHPIERASEFPRVGRGSDGGRGVRAVRGLHRVRAVPLGVSGLGHRRLVRRARRPRVRAAHVGGAAGERRRRDPRLGRRGQRRVAMPRGVRVHRGLPVQRPPGAADHAAAARADEPPRRRLVSRRRATTSTTSGPRAKRAARCCGSRRDRPRGSTCGSGAPATGRSR